jgi:polynucleotide 5'-kinase involved in rRNA processing
MEPILISEREDQVAKNGEVMIDEQRTSYKDYRERLKEVKLLKKPDFVKKTPYIQAIAYYEEENLLLLSMIDKQIKLYTLEFDRKNELIVNEKETNATLYTNFIVTSLQVERHKVKKLLIASVAGG